MPVGATLGVATGKVCIQKLRQCLASVQRDGLQELACVQERSWLSLGLGPEYSRGHMCLEGFGQLLVYQWKEQPDLRRRVGGPQNSPNLCSDGTRHRRAGGLPRILRLGLQWM